ncbi:MAG: aminomethyl-transferring glycine dehydrogenase [Oscillospiraceae bacterium]
MGSYIPAAPAEQQEMLEAIGLRDFRELYKDVPESMYLDRPLDIPAGMSELEVSRALQAMAAKNQVFSTILRGAGAYDHYIPSIVKYIPAKEEFLTAYTPYQAEMSQGLLQSIFEYQTMICQLTGMDVSNASVYDGATAAAEAPPCAGTGSAGSPWCPPRPIPDVIAHHQRPTATAPAMKLRRGPRQRRQDGPGRSPAAAHRTDVACVLSSSSPTSTASWRTPRPWASWSTQPGAMLHHGRATPSPWASLKTPSDCGRRHRRGEGQPLGLPLAWGGPYLGYMATTSKHMRKLPGRIVGQTVDSKGDPAYVLSLQAREQHIRREKASVQHLLQRGPVRPHRQHLSVRHGSRGHGGQVARQCMAKAHYLADGPVRSGRRDPAVHRPLLP